MQAAGYVVRLGGQWSLALLVLAAVVAGGLRIGTWLAQRGLPKHVWHQDLQPSDRIADGFVVYGVEDVRGLEAVVARSLRETRAKEVEAIDEGSAAFISGGTWSVHCPRCHQPTAATTPSWGKAICTACGALYEVEYPNTQARAAIEAALVERPDPAERRWVAGEP